MDTPLERIRSEAKRIEKESRIAAERHYASETPWFQWTYFLGIPSTLLAGIASAAAFKQLANGTVAGIVSIFVAVLSGLITFLNPNQKANAHHASAKGFEAVFRKAGFFYRVESLEDGKKLEDLQKSVTDMNAEYIQLSSAALAAPGAAYRKLEKLRTTGRGGEVISIDSPLEEGLVGKVVSPSKN